MNIVIKYKDSRGRWCREAENVKEKAFILFGEILYDGRSYPLSRWAWLRDKLAQWCLDRAANSTNAEADKWIARYLAIRGIE